MDPNIWRTVSYVVVFVGTGLVLVGSIGTWYFGKRVEDIAPFSQPIRTATATVEITIKSDEKVNTTYMDRGGYIAFGKNNDALLVMSSSQCRARQTSKGEVVYRAVFNMDATDHSVGNPVYSLEETDYVQINFLPMPKESYVLAGTAICTFNSNVRIEIPVHSQNIKNGLIFNKNLEDVFTDLIR